MEFVFKLLSSIVIELSSLSYWICLFVSMICVVLGMAGSEKAKIGTTVSVIVYTVIQCILSAI